MRKVLHYFERYGDATALQGELRPRARAEQARDVEREHQAAAAHARGAARHRLRGPHARR